MSVANARSYHQSIAPCTVCCYLHPMKDIVLTDIGACEDVIPNCDPLCVYLIMYWIHVSYLAINTFSLSLSLSLSPIWPHITEGYINTLKPWQNGRYFADDILKSIFLNENVWISLKISLKFVPKVRIDNIPALVQIMARCRPGDKPLSEPMIISLLTHICVIRP